MKTKLGIIACCMALCSACTTDETTLASTTYYPPANSERWDTVPASELGWKTDAVENLKNYLQSKHSKSCIILINGRIAAEWYFNGHSKDSLWEWNSAGKTLVSATVGIAQEKGLLNIDRKVSDYLGTGWTAEPTAKENLITVRHLLSMTSGLNDSTDLVVRSKLTYLSDAGTRWAYHNVFQKLMDVVSQASNSDFETYFNTQLKAKIGMTGAWQYGLIYKIYHSNTRSMARFGLLALQHGVWNGEQVIPTNYFDQSISSSQTLNPSYGYLWWLNGQNSYRIPGSQQVFAGPLVSQAPADMYAAMGAADQRIYVVPSLKMVVVRMGEASDPSNPSFALSGFDNAFWTKLNALRP